MSAPVRSWLYAPGDRPDLVAKAIAGEADAVVIDLEDAVVAGAKESAREHAVAVLRSPAGKPVWVRVNDVRTPWGRADLEALAGTSAAGVRLPKSEDPDAVAVAAGIAGLPVQLLVESAVGLERAAELARAHPAVAGIALGEADLRADLGVSDEEALGYARGRIVAVARAAGLPAPPQSVHIDLRDLDGLRASSLRARAAGFFGRSVIHPAQVAVVNEVFTPTADELAAARALLDSLDAAAGDGRGALVAADGRFVDAAVAAAARRTLDLASAIGLPGTPGASEGAR